MPRGAHRDRERASRPAGSPAAPRRRRCRAACCAPGPGCAAPASGSSLVPRTGRYPRPAPTVHRMDPLPPVHGRGAGRGRAAARLGGQAKPQLEVGGRTMLAAVLEAVADADRRVVVGPPQPVPEGVVRVREQPPGGGPVAALRAGLPEVEHRRGRRARRRPAVPHLRARSRELRDAPHRRTASWSSTTPAATSCCSGAWRTAALRTAVAATTGPVPLRRVLVPLAPRRLRPAVPPGTPPPWLDCDTPADLTRARAACRRDPTG